MLNLEMTGEEELEAALSGLGSAIADSRLPAIKAGAILSDNLGKRMQSGGDPQYPDITARSRSLRKGDRSAPPLIDTGALLKAVMAKSGGIAGALFDLTPNGLTKGVEGPSVLRLQNGFHGTDKAGRRIDQAARPFMEITESDEREIMEATDSYVQHLLDEFL